MLAKSRYLPFVRLELRKRLRQSRRFAASFILVLLALVGFIIFFSPLRTNSIKKISESKFGALINKAIPVPSPTPSPTPRPLTFEEMNALYGPCVHLPVLMYHHIQSADSAKAKNQVTISVYTDYFKDQMLYLKEKGYSVASMSDLVNFFNGGTPVPAGSVLLTFDDAYGDFYTDAYPILQSLGFRATMFTPTGLVGNPDYLTWDQVSQMTGNILFANHTWSHKNVVVSDSTMQYEISTADTQLADHGLGSPKIFAYPYGLGSAQAEKFLASLGYQAAFTTVPGSTLCKKQRFDLPRIRIGNAPLSYYGF